MVLLSQQTLSEYLPVLELKSPIRRIDPKAENFSISFQVLQIVQDKSKLNFEVGYMCHIHKYFFW